MEDLKESTAVKGAMGAVLVQTKETYCVGSTFIESKRNRVNDAVCIFSCGQWKFVPELRKIGGSIVFHNAIK